MANVGQYRAVLDDLMNQRNELQYKIGEIDAAVAALRRLMPTESQPEVKTEQQGLPLESTGPYTGMSVRWAILALLAENADGPLTTGRITLKLKLGGITSEARHFGANVAAVLSKMNHERKEAETTSEGWVITELGRQTWIQIKASRAREQVKPYGLATVHALPSAQSPHDVAA